jgi:hypothetical protein
MLGNVCAWAVLSIAGGRPEREAILFTLRDLVVLIVVVAVLLWFIYQLRRK